MPVAWSLMKEASLRITSFCFILLMPCGKDWNFMFLMFVAPENTSVPIFSNVAGNVICASRFLQLLKAPSPIVFRFSDRVSLPLNPTQLLKAYGPISVTELGMVRLPVKPQPSKAFFPIFVRLLDSVRMPLNPHM